MNHIFKKDNRNEIKKDAFQDTNDIYNMYENANVVNFKIKLIDPPKILPNITMFDKKTVYLSK